MANKNLANKGLAKMTKSWQANMWLTKRGKK